MISSAVRLTEAEHRTLGALLWQYRSVLERVEFLLEAQLMFASSGRDRRLASIADLLEEAVATISEFDLRRELLLHDADDPAAEAPTLSLLAETSEQPWASMFAEHQRWFEACVARLQGLLAQSRQTMGATLDLVNQLVNAERNVGGYDRTGKSVRAASGSVLFDSRA